MLPSLIGDILAWLIGEAFAGSFLVSAERIALM
jgi:hypothetical protein